MRILILDGIRGQRSRVSVEPTQTVETFCDELIATFGLPTRDFTGQRIDYWLVRLSDDQTLDPSKTLGDTGIDERDTLELISPVGQQVYKTLMEVFTRIEDEIKERAQASIEQIWERVVDRIEQEQPESAEQIRKWLRDENMPPAFEEWAHHLAEGTPIDRGRRIVEIVVKRCSKLLVGALATAALLAGIIAGGFVEAEFDIIEGATPTPTEPTAGTEPTATNTVTPATATELPQSLPSRTLLAGGDLFADEPFREGLRAVFPWDAFDIGVLFVDFDDAPRPVPAEEHDPLLAGQILGDEPFMTLLFPEGDRELRRVAAVIESYLVGLGVQVDVRGTVGAENLVEELDRLRQELPAVAALIPRDLFPGQGSHSTLTHEPHASSLKQEQAILKAERIHLTKDCLNCL